MASPAQEGVKVLQTTGSVAAQADISSSNASSDAINFHYSFMLPDGQGHISIQSFRDTPPSVLKTLESPSHPTYTNWPSFLQEGPTESLEQLATDKRFAVWQLAAVHWHANANGNPIVHATDNLKPGLVNYNTTAPADGTHTDLIA